jgi:type IV secretory pathway VirB2 component (pilin)
VSSALFYAVWGALGAAVLVLWALSYRQGSGLARPSEVVRRLATGPCARIVLVVVVMFLGWHFFAR